MIDLLPQWLREGLSEDVMFWLGYLTNGKHLAWYASVRFTLFAAVAGAAVALAMGLLGATLRNSRLLPVRLIGAGYTNMTRGIPDVLFFIFFPLAFEQTVEWVMSRSLCSAEEIATAVLWPPCPAANIHFDTFQYLLLASVSLGIVYGAFAANVIFGAMHSVAPGQIEAARAFGMSDRQVNWRIRIRQMWIYALPGLSNVWMLLIKSTSLLSLLQITDIVRWANVLGSPNFLPTAGLVHPDWRWQYYMVLLVFYIILTFLSEKGFTALRRRVGRGMITVED